MGQNIFISYRRADSKGYTSRIFDHLQDNFGVERVFMDVTNIGVGEDFVDAINQAISSCWAVIVLIGPHWHTVTDEMGRKRLDDPHDFVRLEVQAALERGIMVVPVLVHGARMPEANDLPVDLRALSDYRPIQIRRRHFKNDIEALICELNKNLDRTEQTPQNSMISQGVRRFPVWVWLLAIISLTTLGSIIFWWNTQSKNNRELAFTAVQTPIRATKTHQKLPSKTPEPATATATQAASTTSIPPTTTETTRQTTSLPITFTPTPFPAELLDALGVRMVFVPAGSFIMGTNGQDPWDIVAQPAHEITVTAFYIDKFEVSNDQYSRCVGAGTCNKPALADSKLRNSYYDNPEYAKFPVIYISWTDAQTYCHWRGGRLPDEAEWEKAARSDDQRPYPWGEALPDCQFTNFTPAKACEGDTLPINSHPDGISPYGVYNMSGNIAEWVDAWFEAYPGGNINASKDFELSYRVIRGGAYFDNPNYIRTTVRKGLPEDATLSYIGFRCVVDLENIP